MKPLIWTIIIFVCAAIFRLTNLDLIEFKLDEANTFYAAVKFYWQSQELVHFEPYLAQNSGVSSTGFYNMPLFYYLMTLLTLPAKDPAVVSFLIALVNSIMVALFYLVIRKYYGQIVALCGSLIMATSPWMILYSRKIWGPDLILAFTLPFFFFLHRLILDKKPKAIFGVVLSLVLLFQLHYSGAALILITAAVILIFKVKISWKAVILGLMLGIIPLLPFLGGPIRCQDCVLPQEERTFDVNNLFRPLQIINGSYFENVLGDDYTLFLEEYSHIKLLNFLFILEYILIFIGGYFLFKEKKYRFLLVFLIITPLLYVFIQTPARIYYFLVLSPFLILTYAFWSKWMWEKGIGGKVGLVSLISLILLSNVIFQLSFNSFLAQKQTISGDYGPIYKLTKQFTEEKLAPEKNNPDYDLIQAEFFVKLFTNQITF